MTSARQQEQVDRNYDFFVRHLGSFIDAHEGEYALLRDEQVVGFFRNVTEADRAGRAKYPDGVYSIQEVTDEPIDLGIFSHAGT